MASRKAVKMGKKAKAVVDSVRHPPFLRIFIPAQQAKPAPPLGPQLGKRNINIASFCKDFNEQTNDIKPGVPIPCTILINPDRSYTLQKSHPPNSYLLRLAAGCKKGAATPGSEISGRLTLKHIYEIALLKKEDPSLQSVSLQSICISLLNSAHRIGIEVLPRDTLNDDPGFSAMTSIDHTPESYAIFLKQRELDVAARKQTLEEKKQAKLMRVS